MPINYEDRLFGDSIRANQTYDFATLRLSCSIFADETLSALKQFYTNASVSSRLSVLWDFQEGFSKLPIKNEDLLRIITYLSKHVPKNKQRKIAIVTRTDYQFELSKKIELFSLMSSLPIRIQVYRSYKEAILWLAS